MAATQKNINLSLAGLRMGPVDPKSKVPKVGTQMQFQIEDQTTQKVPKFLNKERSGFSGGFKIPQEQRFNKLKRKIQHQDGEDSEDHEEYNKTDITKDEIMAHLNLGSGQAAGGSGKHGAGSKTALSKDLMDNLEKELEKLKRTEENIRVRKHIATKGDRSILEETEEDRNRQRDQAIYDDLQDRGNNMIRGDQRAVQLIRHRVGQLDSVKNVPYEELEAMRMETADRLAALEEQYWGKKEGSQVGPIIRDKYKEYGTAVTTPGASAKTTKTKASTGILKKQTAPEFTPKFDYKNAASSGGGGGDLRKRKASSGKRIQEPIEQVATDPRQQIYEAKFEKYLANKGVMQGQAKRKESQKKDDFDLYTKGHGSPSKLAKRYKTFADPTAPTFSGRYNEDELLPRDQDAAFIEQETMRKQAQRPSGDPFANLGVSAADKMSFFLLKWVFNAIKRDSDEDDPKFKGSSYVSKNDLLKQLAQNPELLHALGYSDAGQLKDNVKLAASKKEGYLMWSEFLDFFFLKDAPLYDRIDGHDWWNQLDQGGMQIVAKEETEFDPLAEGTTELRDNLQDSSAQQMNISNLSGGAKAYAGHPMDSRPVKMTASLQVLQDSRATKAENEVEEEFAKMAADKKAAKANPAPKPAKAKVAEYESIDMEVPGEGFGFGREKSVNLMLSSQMQVMKEVFDRLDRYNEGILRRSDYVMALRCDIQVIDFIDCEAVKKAYSNTKMTLDQVLLEIEKDETYDQANNTANQQELINHKEFLTWREFTTYFTDYQDIDARNKKQSQFSNVQKSTTVKKDENGEEFDEANEIMGIMEQEKQRRLMELPKLRPADQLDISEKQLQLLKDIFDSVPRQGGGRDLVNTLTFFITIRKDPQIRQINTAIARDPEGYSRLARETFQEVFDRMEREIQQKQVDWSTIVEFFTKRGRPLSKDEIQKLVDQDRIQREGEENQKRADEEAERRRNQRIQGDLEEEEDFEALEMREKNENILAQSNSQRESFGEQMDGMSGEEDDIQRAEGEYGLEEDSPGNLTTKGSERDENLGRTRLNQSDYVKRAESAKAAKKGKYGVTVPKPFGFDMRDKVKAKTIREVKVEAMINAKKAEEASFKNYQIRSKPIPPEVLIPRYQSICEANEARRQQIRAHSVAVTRQREAPFSFWEAEKERQRRRMNPDPADLVPEEMKRPQFKANPIPRACSVLIFEQKNKEDAKERTKRINQNAGLLLQQAQMPPSMQKWADKKAQEAPKKLEVEYPFKPKITPTAANHGEALRKKADAFHNELKNKQGQKKKVMPVSPDFPSKKRPQKPLPRPALNEGSQTQLDKHSQMLKERAAKYMAMEAGSQQTNPSSTKAVERAQAERRRQQEAKKKAEDQAIKAREAREAKNNKNKAAIQAELAAAEKKRREEGGLLSMNERVKKRQEDARQEELRNKKFLADAIKKAQNRPRLHETTQDDLKKGSSLAMIKATAKMVALLKASGESEKDIDRYLPADYKEKKEELELEEKFKAKMKK